MVTTALQILVGLANGHRSQGGKEFPSPFSSFIGVSQVLMLDMFELLHLGCAMGGDFGDKLYLGTLVPLGVLALVLVVRGITVAFTGGRFLGKNESGGLKIIFMVGQKC